MKLDVMIREILKRCFPVKDSTRCFALWKVVFLNPKSQIKNPNILSHQRYISCHTLRFVAGGSGRVNDLVNVSPLLHGFSFESAVPAGVDVGGFENELPPAVVNEQPVGFHKVIALHGFELVVQPVAVGREGVGQVK